MEEQSKSPLPPLPREPDDYVAGEFSGLEEPEYKLEIIFPREYALDSKPIEHGIDTPTESPETSVSASGQCYRCKRTFSFNRERVPSIHANADGTPDPKGARAPICRECVERTNPRRIANGLPPIVILEGAYEAVEAG
jgi:hypothetical protein